MGDLASYRRKRVCTACGEPFVSVSKDAKSAADYCPPCSKKRSPFGRMNGFGQRHRGFNGPGRKP